MRIVIVRIGAGAGVRGRQDCVSGHNTEERSGLASGQAIGGYGGYGSRWVSKPMPGSLEGRTARESTWPGSLVRADDARADVPVCLSLARHACPRRASPLRPLGLAGCWPTQTTQNSPSEGLSATQSLGPDLPRPAPNERASGIFSDF